MIRRWVALAILIAAVGACGPFCGNGKLNLSNGKLNPTSFTCPSGAQDYGYDLTGSVDADNETNKTIIIKSMSTSVTVVKLVGDNWSTQVGETSGADDLDFSPRTINSASKTTFKFSTPWTCSDSGKNTVETYADFKVELVMVTSSGTYKANLPNHRMKMA
jgi:hypothetical protein